MLSQGASLAAEERCIVGREQPAAPARRLRGPEELNAAVTASPGKRAFPS